MSLLAKAPPAMQRSRACGWPLYDGAEGNPANALAAYDEIAKDKSVDPCSWTSRACRARC